LALVMTVLLFRRKWLQRIDKTSDEQRSATLASHSGKSGSAGDS
jgi:hypothetical protein